MLLKIPAVNERYRTPVFLALFQTLSMYCPIKSVIKLFDDNYFQVGATIRKMTKTTCFEYDNCLLYSIETIDKQTSASLSLGIRSLFVSKCYSTRQLVCVETLLTIIIGWQIFTAIKFKAEVRVCVCFVHVCLSRGQRTGVHVRSAALFVTNSRKYGGSSVIWRLFSEGSSSA